MIRNKQFLTFQSYASAPKRPNVFRGSFGQLLGLGLLLMALLSFSSAAAYTQDISVKSMVLQKQDLPEGMVFGKVPDRAKGVIKGNPWILDSKSIKKLARAIYGGANPHSINRMAMVILTDKEKPYGDDIVYYVFKFTNKQTARKEIKKLEQVVRYNSKRVMLLKGKKSAIMIFSDEEEYFSQVTKLSLLLKQKIR